MFLGIIENVFIIETIVSLTSKINIEKSLGVVLSLV
jgi:hypothetical protein